MINEPPVFKGLNIRIPIIIPIKGRGFINQGSGLSKTLGTDVQVARTCGHVHQTDVSQKWFFPILPKPIVLLK